MQELFYLPCPFPRTPPSKAQLFFEEQKSHITILIP